MTPLKANHEQSPPAVNDNVRKDKGMGERVGMDARVGSGGNIDSRGPDICRTLAISYLTVPSHVYAMSRRMPLGLGIAVVVRRCLDMTAAIAVAPVADRWGACATCCCATMVPGTSLLLPKKIGSISQTSEPDAPSMLANPAGAADSAPNLACPAVVQQCFGAA